FVVNLDIIVYNLDSFLSKISFCDVKCRKQGYGCFSAIPFTTHSKALPCKRFRLPDIVVLAFTAMLGSDNFGGLGNIELSVDHPLHHSGRSGGRLQHVSHPDRLGTLLVEPVLLCHKRAATKRHCRSEGPAR